MAQPPQTVGHVVSAVTSPLRGLLFIILGGGMILALVGVVGTLVGAISLHLLSPHTSVWPLLRLAGLAAVGGTACLVACAVPGVALSKRR